MKYFSKILIALAFTYLTACDDEAKWAFEPIDLETPDLLNMVVPNDEVIISITDDSISVGDLRNAKIKVLVGPNLLVKGADNKVELKIDDKTLGGFLGANPDGSQTLPVNARGEVQAIIIPKAAGRLVLTASIGGVEREAHLTFFKEREISIDSTNSIADNFSVAKILFKGNATDINREVVFETDRGTFSNNQLTYIARVTTSMTAIALLKNTRVERANIKVSIRDVYSVQGDIGFSVAYPDDILVESAIGALERKSGLAVGLKATLLKVDGAASEGQTVFFKDSIDGGGSVGVFLNVTKSNSKGEALAEFHLQDTTFTGPVYFIGKVWTGTSTEKVGKSRIIVR